MPTGDESQVETPLDPEPHDTEHDLELIVERLEDQFDTIDGEIVDDVVHQCAARFDHAPVQNFVGLLTEKAARRQLRASMAKQNDDGSTN